MPPKKSRLEKNTPMQKRYRKRTADTAVNHPIRRSLRLQHPEGTVEDLEPPVSVNQPQHPGDTVQDVEPPVSVNQPATQSLQQSQHVHVAQNPVRRSLRLQQRRTQDIEHPVRHTSFNWLKSAYNYHPSINYRLTPQVQIGSTSIF